MKEIELLFDKEEAEVITLYPDQEKSNEIFEFWYKEDDEIKLNRQQFLTFLEKKGYRKLYIGKDYIFVKVDNNIVKEVTTVHIKDYVSSFIKNLGKEKKEEFNYQIILGKIINQSATLFSRNFLEFIPNLEGQFKRDTEEESFIYYQNCFVRVTKEGYNLHNYNELEGFIWESQKLKRDFYKSEKESVFYIFLTRICKEDLQRFNSLVSGMGYLMHDYKDPENTKAVIFIDEKIDDGANGRCGKSLVGKAIGKIRKSARPDGQNFQFEKFMLQAVQPDTAIIDFNDAKKNFPFEKLFSMITDDMPIEKKNKDQIIIPFEDSPKILITTNYSIRGFDESTLDRQFIIEFSDHYNRKHKPTHEFGKKFFISWTTDEWNDFDNFMIRCIQYYLKNGLVGYIHINLNKKNIIETTSDEFVEFMEEIKVDVWLSKKETFEKFINTYSDYNKNFHQKTFTSWIKLYAKLRGLKYDEKKSGTERSFMISGTVMDGWTNPKQYR